MSSSEITPPWRADCAYEERGLQYQVKMFLRRYVITLFCAAGLILWLAQSAFALEAQSAQPIAWLDGVIRERGILLGVVAVFFGGLALNLTPCVYPLIPVTLAFFSSQSSGRPFRIFLLALCYVLGISLSYAALGITAAKTGALLGSWLQKPAILIGISALIIALSLSMFGLYELRPPKIFAQRVGRAQAGMPGAFVMGLVVGVIAAPCIGPFVLSLFLLVGKLGNVAYGFLLFFVMGLGMGTPYILLGFAANRANRLPRSGEWLVWAKKVLGCILLGVAVYLLAPLLPGGGIRFVVAGLLLGSGVYLGWLERSRSRQKWFVMVRWLTGVILVVAALAMVLPRPEPAASVNWAPYRESHLDEARRTNTPVVIDIYADWCLPCVELDHVTFRHPDVVEVLSGMVTLRVDATIETDLDRESEALIEAHDVYGMPTVMLFDKTGKERTDLRVSGFLTPSRFLERLKELY